MTALTKHAYFKSPNTKKIAVFDLKEPPSLDAYFKSSVDEVPEQRTSTLTAGSLRFLKDIDAMEFVNMERCASYHRIQVWEKDGSSFIGFGHKDNKSMGRTIENSHLVAAMYHKLKLEVGPK